MKRLVFGLLLLIGICEAKDLPLIEFRQSQNGKVIFMKKAQNEVIHYYKITHKMGRIEFSNEKEFQKGKAVSHHKAKSFLYRHDHAACVEENLGFD